MCNHTIWWRLRTSVQPTLTPLRSLAVFAVAFPLGRGGLVNVLLADHPALQRSENGETSSQEEGHRYDEMNPHWRMDRELEPHEQGHANDAYDTHPKKSRAVGRFSEAVVQPAVWTSVPDS